MVVCALATVATLHVVNEGLHVEELRKLVPLDWLALLTLVHGLDQQSETFLEMFEEDGHVMRVHPPLWNRPQVLQIDLSEKSAIFPFFTTIFHLLTASSEYFLVK